MNSGGWGNKETFPHYMRPKSKIQFLKQVSQQLFPIWSLQKSLEIPVRNAESQALPPGKADSAA